MSIVYTSRVFSVEELTVRAPGGRDHHVSVVRHPGSVVLLPVRDDGRVVLIRQFRASIDREIWEVPAGKVDEGETPDQAAMRECEEEIKLVPRVVTRLGSFYPTPGFCDEEMLFFKVTSLAEPPPDSAVKADEDEEIEVTAVTVAEARAMVARGEIVDLKTAYALTLVNE